MESIRTSCAATLVRRASVLLLLVLTAAAVEPEPAGAQPACTRETFRMVVDDTGQSLRRLYAEAQPRLAAALRRLKDVNGWSEDDYIDKALDLVMDERAASLDNRAADLLARLDKLAETESDTPDCSRLADLEAAAVELQATVRAKTEYTIAQLDRLARERGAASRPSAPKAAEPKIAEPRPELKPNAPPPGAPREPVLKGPPPPPAAQPKAPPSAWTTITREDPLLRDRQPTQTPPPVVRRPLPLSTPSQDGFSVEEIREASRGFFGTISSGLASVIEHAFSQAGRPNGYVLGNEGGGAFIAGVRYGSGTLFTRGGRSRDVYWHGPSIGYDFGASGAKTLFLVYNLREDIDIFSGFSGVEGSAYLVGGVGLTFVTDGRLVLAPIRSGLGLRLGANIGYLRFTARPTWNPF